MDRLLSYIVRLMVWLSGSARLLARLHLCQYEEWQKGKPLKVLLVGYNGARNTGADARVVALVRQLDEMLGADTLHSSLLPDNLFVADATILPQALGLPPMLTIMALAKRIAKNIKRDLR